MKLLVYRSCFTFKTRNFICLIANLRLKPDDPNAVYGDALEVYCHLRPQLLDILAKAVTLRTYHNAGFYKSQSIVNFNSYVLINTTKIQYTLDLLSTQQFLPKQQIEGILLLDKQKYKIPCDFIPGM